MAEKLNNLSSNIVKIMFALSENIDLVKLIAYDKSTPFTLPDIDGSSLLVPSNPEEKPRISPYPFDTEATVEDGTFIRVYYNQGEFNENETIQEMQLNVDIICAKNLWLIRDDRRSEIKSVIRPYEIMDRIIDTIGRKGMNGHNVHVNFTGWQHLYVNTKFDAIRLYSDYFSVEAENYYGTL